MAQNLVSLFLTAGSLKNQPHLAHMTPLERCEVLLNLNIHQTKKVILIIVSQQKKVIVDRMILESIVIYLQLCQFRSVSDHVRNTRSQKYTNSK